MYPKMVILLLFIIAGRLSADKNLVVHLKTPPNSVIASVKTELLREGIEDDLSRLDKGTWSLGGFLATYGGYFDYSDPDGAVTFPLRHDVPRVNLVIAPRISMVKLDKETISHVKEGDDTTVIIPEDQIARMYLFEKSKNEDDLWVWTVSEEPIPKNRRISNLAVVLLTDPRNIFVSVGSFPVSQEEQMFLPDIYVTGRFNVARAITDNIEITKYMEPIKKKVEDVKQPRMERKLVTND